MAYLAVERVSKRFRSTVVLEELSLQVARGEFVSLLGPSGCGKTTLLRILAGLLAADTGSVALDGHDLGRLPPHRRNVSVVFQNYALFPHLTVAENVAFGPRARGRSGGDIARTVERLLALVQLPDMGDRRISALSGGQQQRVAMARALATEPDLILLDEPLSALDRKLRETMQVELRRLLRDLGMTAIFVTHDQEEALALSDRVAVMNAGRIEQLDTSEAVYARPATPFVLDFVGQSTVLHGTVGASDGRALTIDTALGPVHASGPFARGSRVMLAVRPEHMQPGAAADDSWTSVTTPVAGQTFLGRICLLYCSGGPADRIIVEVPAQVAASLSAGGSATVSWRIADALVFPAP
ncbi:MAG: ABC transporter ATP-binding protein [Acetobacteraceae bacterium]